MSIPFELVAEIVCVILSWLFVSWLFLHFKIIKRNSGLTQLVSSLSKLIFIEKFSLGCKWNK